MIVSITSFAVLALLAGAPTGAGPPATTAAKITVAAGGGGGDGSAPSVTIVVKDGGTHVQNNNTPFVSVTPNDGKSQLVPPGARAELTGTPLRAPSLLSPNDKEKVKVKPTDKGLGPIVLSWAPVAGAKEYELEFQVDNGPPKLLKVQRTEYRLPPLPPGKVLWAVRSVSDGITSDTARRWFELQADELKLNVQQGGGWK
ncbi:MAG TPA: hypothetical protein VFB81_23995 [Myxococcales bacterium]|nr:hypothetical protein [Myxococcales bacterium]